MDKTHTLDGTLQGVTWGALFVWWGFTGLVGGLPEGAGIIGTGLILLGLNAARRLKDIPMDSFSTTLGVLALVVGGVSLANSVMSLPFELPVLAIVLIVLGAIIIARAMAQAVSEPSARTMG